MKKYAIFLAVLSLWAAADAGSAMAQEETRIPNVVGDWVATVHRPATEGNLSQQWVLRQDGANVSGTIKSNGSELPLVGKMNGLILRATVTDGDMRYVVNVSVSSKGDTMDGTFRMGAHEYILNAKRP